MGHGAKHTGHEVDWSLLSPQGRVLFYVALCPSCSVEEIARALGLTERSVWTIVRSLRRMDMIRYERDGRRHRYTVNLDAPLLAPTIEGLTLRSVLGNLADEELREVAPDCVHID
jgi:DNA-binding IclR family transcriptional regulator